MISKLKKFGIALSKSDMKQTIGGYVPVEGGRCRCAGQSGSVAHCYGSQANCTGAAWGSCTVTPGQTCWEYCVVGTTTCWVYA